MRLFQQIRLGLKSYKEAITFIFANKLWGFLLFPVVLNILLFVGGFSLISSFIAPMQTWLLDLTSLKDADFFLSDFLKDFLLIAIWLLIKVLFILVFAFFGGYVVIILLSPVLAYLSERTEKIITGNEAPFQFMQFIRDVFRGIALALRNLMLESFYILLLFFLSFLPLVGLITPILLFFISSYFYGFSFMDYTNERKKLSIRASIVLVRKHKAVAIINGAVFASLLLIPWVGTTLAGFAAIVAVVAATIAMQKVVIKV